MSSRDDYPAGVPCWVEVLAPDPRAAAAFYGSLLGWELGDPGPMAAPGGEYFVARKDGRDVVGIGTLPAGTAPAAVWSTYVRVDSVDASVEVAQAAGGRLVAGPLDALPAGRLAVLLDPAGAAFALWEAAARVGAQLVNEPGTWAMSSLHTPDPQGAAAFYAAVFGWQAVSFGPPEAAMTLLSLPGYVGGEPLQPIPRDVVAVVAAPDPSVPPHWNVNLRVADADRTADLASTLGGQVLMGPFDTPGFRNAVLADPQGAAFSVSQLA